MNTLSNALQPKDLAQLVKDDRVHASVYEDQAIFEREMQSIFGGSWIYVGHESEIPNRGDFVTTQIGLQPVIVTRHRDGKPHVLHNRCGHRAAIVCNEERGNTGSSFRCGYHGWTFRTNGELLAAPLKNGYPECYDLRKPEFGLVPIRVESYRGFLFANASASMDEPFDLPAHLGHMKDCIDALCDRAPDGEVDLAGGVQKYMFHGNWKAQIENLNDNYHPPFAHAATTDERQRQFKRRYGDGDGVHLDTTEQGSKWDRVAAVGLGWGTSYCGPLPFDQGARGGPLYESHLDALRARHPEARVKSIMTDFFHNVIVYPSVVMQLASSHVRTIRPIAVGRTEIRVYPIRLKGAPEEVNRQIIRYLNTTHSAGSLIQSDDVEMFRRVQSGLASEAQEWVWFNRHMQDDATKTGGGTSEVIMRNQYHAGYLRYLTGERA